jgi:hypothetical protein
MTQPQQYRYPTLSRLFLIVGTILLVIAALIAGKVFNGAWLPWALGGLASWCLAGAV